LVNRERDLFECLKRLRDYRALAVYKKWNPWMVRQALVMVLELDTIALQEHGVDLKAIEEADRNSRSEARRMRKEMPI